ncbi:MAG: molybdate ABC transporter substrate-binding protein [Saprospiraceae bacterium]
MRYFFIFLCALSFACCNHTEQASPLRVTAAANLQFPIQDITAAFTKKTNIPCETIIGSSGKLTAQIKEGAPYDIFISANQLYPNTLHQAGRTTSPPVVIGEGKLVLLHLTESIELEALLNPNIKHIAIANPKVAPYGAAAMEVLKNQEGLYEKIEHKIVYGESIAQVNQFVATGVADVGFTALSAVIALQKKQKSFWTEINTKDHSPIKQTMVLLKNNRNKTAEAKQFQDFILSSDGKSILKKYGYIVD